MNTIKPSQLTLNYNDISINTQKHQVKIGKVLRHFSPLEFEVLVYFLDHQDQIISREDLLTDIWHMDCIITTRAVDDVIKRLRKKLIQFNSTTQIQTVRAYGFILCPCLQQKKNTFTEHCNRQELTSILLQIIEKLNTPKDQFRIEVIDQSDSAHRIEIYITQD